MKFQTEGLSNIHLAVAEAPAAGPVQTPEAHVPRFCKARRNPNEEFSFRCARDGAPMPLPNEVAAILLAQRGEAKKCGRNGIDIIIDGQPYRYWHEDSRVCANPEHFGRVFYVRAQEHRDCIHLLDVKGRYIETLPLAATPDWFSAEAAEERRKTRAVADRIKKDLNITHTETRMRKAVRDRDNRETMLSTVDFKPDAAGRTEAPAQTTTARRDATRHPVDLSRAGDLADIIGETDRMRAAHKAGKKKARDRIRDAAGDVDDLLMRDRRIEAEEEESSADISALL